MTKQKWQNAGDKLTSVSALHMFCCFHQCNKAIVKLR